MPCHGGPAQPSPAQCALARSTAVRLAVCLWPVGGLAGRGGRAGGRAGWLSLFLCCCPSLSRGAGLCPHGSAHRTVGQGVAGGGGVAVVGQRSEHRGLGHGVCGPGQRAGWHGWLAGGLACWLAGWVGGGRAGWYAGGGAGGGAGSVAAVAEQRRSSDGHKRTSVHGRCERRPMAPLALAARPSALDPGVNHARPSRPMEQRLNIAQHIITCEPLGRRLCLRFAAGLFLEHEAL